MADEINKATKVNGAKYFFYKKPGDEWRGSFKQQNFW